MQQDWPQKVKTIYDRLISDLSLDATDVPLFVGETVRSEMGGACGGHNSVIATVPSKIPNSYVISSEKLAQKGDGLHFTAASYRIIGQRYAKQALHLMNIEAEIDEPEELPVLTGDLEIDHRFKSLAEIGTKKFAIVNENEHVAIYCKSVVENPQFIYCDTYDKSLSADNPTFFTFCTLKEKTTGIDVLPVNSEKRIVKSGVYTLDGRKVNGENLRPGLYIINGKKVAIGR